MLDVRSDVVQFKGNHYDFGFKQGEQLQNSPILSNRNKQWFEKRKRNFTINNVKFERMLHTYAPAIWEEINGLADALKLNMDDAIQQFGGYYIEFERSGCSIFTGEDYLVRNYDSHPRGYEGRYVIYKPTDSGYASMGPSMQITGRTDGINEKGLVMGYNFINRRGSMDGFLCNMIGRIILETCANVDEAISLLKEIPHRTSFSYVLLDSTGVTQVVEASPRTVKVRESNVCTNHFETLTDENRYRMDDSMRRQNTILQKQPSITHSYDAFRMMNNKEEGVFSTKYGASAGTLHTSIYYPKEIRAGFSLGGNQPPFIFDFNEWMQGKSVTIKQIRGKLETKFPLANM